MTDREKLEARAKKLEVTFQANIGDAKLAAKIKKAEADAKEPELEGETEHEVIDPVRRDGKLYAPGDPIMLDAASVKELSAAGVISLPDTE